MKAIEADYLVVGAGAMGMAFLDTLLTETEARVVLVDRHHQPGGHWTTAYPFVRLHQPSAFYRVNSLPLGTDAIDDKIKAAFTAQLRAVRDAASVDDLFSRLEAAGALLRIDPAIRPTMYRCATVTHAELQQLRRITDVVRMGHLLRADADGMVLEGGAVSMDSSVLYVDCTADGVAEKRPATTVFEPGRITLQSVRGCQQIFSAALIAHVESAYPDDAARNELCPPLPHPDTDLDWLRVARADYGNQLRWLDDADLAAWLATARLDLFGHLMGHLLAPASAKPRVRERILRMARSALSATAAKLDELMADELSCNPS